MELGVDPQLAIDLMSRMQAHHPMSSATGSGGVMGGLPSGGTHNPPPPSAAGSQHGGDDDDPAPPPQKKKKVVKDKVKAKDSNTTVSTLTMFTSPATHSKIS